MITERAHRNRVRWLRVAVTALLIAEVAVLVAPVLLGSAEVPMVSPRRVPPTQWERSGVLVATSTVLLVVAGCALVVVWLRPRSVSWLAPFSGAHAAAAGLGWSYRLPWLAAGAAVAGAAAIMLALVGAAGRE